MHLLENNLTNLYKDLEMEGKPEKTKAGLFELSLNSNIRLFFKELEKSFYVFALISKISSLQTEKTLTHFMRGNFLGLGTNGYSLGIDKEEQHLTLSTSFSHKLSYSHFKQMIEDFANTVDYWREEVYKLQNNADHYTTGTLNK